MGQKPASCAEAALYELCLKYGYCLPPDAQDRLLANPPPTSEAFAEALLLAEGLDPMDSGRATVEGVIRDWLFDEGVGRGSRSGLPRFA
jgi:hypothetical protein